MKTRQLGRTGLQVSEIGFGAWGLGATMWRGVTDDEGVAAIRAALDAGVNFMDTALAYGDGHSEQLVGRTAPRAVIATKIAPQSGGWPAQPGSKIADVFPPAYVRACTERSLRYLGRDKVEVQQFHVWHDTWVDQPAWSSTRAEMEKLTREGKVGHWGISINAHAPDTA